MTMSTEDAAMIAKMQQQLAERDSELAESYSKIAERDSKIAERDSKIAGMSLCVLKERAFVFVDRTASKPHCASDTHRKSALQSTIVSLGKFPEKVWDARYIRPVEGNEVSVDSESMVVTNVVLILEALFVGFGIKDLVQVSTQRIVAGVELDIVLLFGPQRIPFATIEVKKPGIKGFNDQIIFEGEDPLTEAGVTTGQNLDQLNAIGLFGFRSVFGMITHGNKWMITSTTEFTENNPLRDWDLGKLLRGIETGPSNISPEQNLPFSPEHTTAYLVSSSTATATEEEGSGGEKNPVEEESGGEEEPNDRAPSDDRVLYASQVVEFRREGVSEDVAGENVLQLMAEFIRLACESFRRRDPKSIGVGTASCRVLDLTVPQRCSFQKMKFPSKLPWEFTSSRHKQLYLMSSLGRGEYGDCCFGMSKDGKKCGVAKFFLRHDGCIPIALAEKERENWKKVYGNTFACQVGRLPAGGSYLWMPYLRPIPRKYRLLERKNVEAALERFANSGYKHNDIRWRHFGLYDGKMYLCDLGDIGKIEEKDKKSWIAASLDVLDTKRVFTEKHSTPTEPVPPASSTDEEKTSSLGVLDTKKHSTPTKTVPPASSTDEEKTSKRKRDEET